MKAVLYNRLLVVFAFLGIFIAGVLTLEKLMGLQLPCGAAHGCDIIASHPSSAVFGIPTAAFGLGAYLVLAALAVQRSLAGFERTSKLLMVGYGVAALGTLISVGLQLYAIYSIHATCLWCLSSAVVMTLTLIVYALLAQTLEDGIPDALKTARPDIGLVVVLAVASVAGVAIMGLGKKASLSENRIVKEDVLKQVDLVPSDAHIFGDASSKITIVEFADICCPSCQKTSPKVEDFVRQYPGRVRMVYRHFLWSDKHKNANLAAAMSEYAATKGKFFEFVNAAMGQGNGTEIEDSDLLYTAAKDVQLDKDDMMKHIADDNDPIYDKITQDMKVGNKIGVQATPTFILQVPGQPTQALSSGALLDALSKPPVSTMLDGKA